MPHTKERILFVAIIYNDRAASVDWYVPIQKRVLIGTTGARHNDIIRNAHRSCLEHDAQGFWTSHDRFVDRKEAAKIAFEAGQIPEEKSELFSEDLW